MSHQLVLERNKPQLRDNGRINSIMASQVQILSVPLSKRLVWVGAIAGFGGYFGIPFHLLSVGSIFSPLFIPIGIACCLVEPYLAVCIGFLIPLFSGLQTGMPPFHPPFIWLVLFEAVAYGLSISVFRLKFQKSGIQSVIGGIVIGKLILFLFIFFCGYPIPEKYANILIRSANHQIWSMGVPWNSVTTGLPGSLLALLVVPFIVKWIESHTDSGNGNMAAA